MPVIHLLTGPLSPVCKMSRKTQTDTLTVLVNDLRLRCFSPKLIFKKREKLFEQIEDQCTCTCAKWLVSDYMYPWVPEGFFRSEAVIVSGKAAIEILA